MSRRRRARRRIESWSSVENWQGSTLPDRAAAPSPFTVWTGAVVPPVPVPVRREADAHSVVVW